MKRNSGQALIEFVVILPVFLLLVLNIIDFGNILYEKYELENNLDYIVDLYYEGKIDEVNNYSQSKNIIINYAINDSKIEIKKKVTVNSPGLNLILKNPYFITTERHLYDE